MRKFYAFIAVFFMLSLQANAACDNADLAVKSGDYKKAVKYYRKCAAENDAESMYKLASLYTKGLGIATPDKRAAKRFYVRAAEVGYAPAQIMLGIDLILGNASSADKTEGYKWLLLAAEKADNKWIYPIKNTADSDKVITYLKQVNDLVTKNEKKDAGAAAGIFKQEKIFAMAKLALGQDDYKDFMEKYEQEGEARDEALEKLKIKAAEYKK